MADLSKILSSGTDKATFDLLYKIGRFAKSQGMEAYLVGGTVRDMLLGLDSNDPDISVVGNAQVFAKTLYNALDGKNLKLSQFGTANLDLGWKRLDIVTARKEKYITPGALPDITPAPIEYDLKRRDFTLNAMAIALAPDKFGEFLDPTNGLKNLNERRIKSINKGSFSDDPTRAFRAVRYASRLDFTLSEDTQEELVKSLHHIRSVSPSRIGAEFKKILLEPKRADILAMAETLGIIAAIDLSIHIGYVSLELLRNSPDNLPITYYLACISASLNRQESEILARCIDAQHQWREALVSCPRYRAVAPLLEQQNLYPSEVVAILEDIPQEGLAVQLRILPPTLKKMHIHNYLTKYKNIIPEVNGHDLIELGFKEGAIIGQVLGEIKRAKLDGHVRSKNEEIQFAQERLRYTIL